MNNKISLFFLLLLVFFVSPGFSQIIVPDMVPNIQTAVLMLAPVGGTIQINNTYTGEGGPMGWPVDIFVPFITIQGLSGGETIPGNGVDKIFVINANNCTIQNLKFVNAGGNDLKTMAPVPGSGGAIYVTPSAAYTTISGCIFSGNASPASINGGAGIFLDLTGNVTIQNCQFLGNVANNDGGGIKIYKSLNVHINLCLFQDNIALNNIGGGVCVKECSGVPVYPYNVHIENSEFYKNSSGFDGGAIGWWESDGVIDLNIIGNKDSGNTSDYGGGISVVNCTSPSLTLITNNTIHYNQANGIVPCPWNGGWGGGIFIEDSDNSVKVQSNAVVSSNTATFYGGGIAINSFSDDCYPEILQNDIQYNKVTTDSGTFERNGGGGICVHYLAPRLGHPLIKQNLIQGNEVLGGGNSSGGGIACIHAAPAIEQNTIQNNTAMIMGGGIGLNTSYMAQMNQGNIIDNTIKNNYGNNFGGGIYMAETGPFYLDRNIIDSNQAGSGFGVGGGLCMVDSHLTARCNNFVNNEAAKTSGTAVAMSGSSTLKFYNNTVADNNMSVPNGDAMALLYSADLQNNIFSGHTNLYAIKEYSVTDPSITCINNLFWNNAHVYYDLILKERDVNQLNAMAGNSGNLSGDPLLDSTYHLSSGFSPAFNGGVDLTGLGVTFDIDLESRPYGAAFDIGSDEFYPITSVKDWSLF